MKFKITTADFAYMNKDAERLKTIGFTFTPYLHPCVGFDQLMDKGQDVEIELNSLEDLLDFIKTHGQIIIEEEGNIIIYDDWVE